MEELENLSPEQQAEQKAEKERKSRIRIFGLLVIICVLLLVALIYEIVLISKPDSTTTSEIASAIALLK